MPLEHTMSTPAARPAVAAALLAAATLAVLTVSGCQTTGTLMHPFAHPAQPVPAKEPQSGVSTDLTLLGTALDATPADRAHLRASAEAAYQAHSGARETLRLALLLATSNISPANPRAAAGSDDTVADEDDAPTSDLTRAQKLLTNLLSDSKPALDPDEQTLARLELVLITRQLTLQTENRTLRSTGAQQLADFNHRLRSAAQETVSLRRQLGEARAKLAAITNIEKSLNEGKLGNGATP